MPGAFKTCAEPGRLGAHAAFFAPDVEFYHDTGGVTWSRDATLANTRQYVCDHVRCELVPGSLRIYPVKDFDVIAEGAHRCCQFDSGRCDGVVDFVITWRQRDGPWEITRVLNVGHRSAR